MSDRRHLFSLTMGSGTCFRVGGRLYKNVVLHSDARLPLREAWRGEPVRPQHAERRFPRSSSLPRSVTVRDSQAVGGTGCRLRPGVILAGPATGSGVPGRAQVRTEERQDAPAGVVRRGLVVSGSRHQPSEDGEQDRCVVPGAFVIVEELVPGLRVLLYVVLDSGSRQRLLQPGCRAPQRPVLAP